MMGNVKFRSGNLIIAGQLHLPQSELFAPPYPGVVVCHGMGSRKEFQAGFGAFMAQHGFAVLCFDFRGHGESEGVLDDGALDDVTAALDYLAGRPEVDSARLALRGSSMGGMLALHATRREARVRAVAAIAPAAESVLTAGVESGALVPLIERAGLSVRLDERAFVRYLRAHNLRAEIRHIAPRAVLLIHCKGDELIPFRLTEELFAVAGEPKKLVLIENGHHRLAQQAISAHQITREWLEKYSRQ